MWSGKEVCKRWGLLQEEYGPFEKKDLMRLAPQQGLFEDIRKKWEERMEADRMEKVSLCMTLLLIIDYGAYLW